MRKTSISVDEPVWREAKKAAAERGITIQSWLTEAIRAQLGLNPAQAVDLDPRIQRHLAGLSALYARSGEESAALISMIEAGLKAAGVLPPSARSHRKENE